MPCFGTVLDAALVAEWARSAEGAGWDGFFLWDLSSPSRRDPSTWWIEAIHPWRYGYTDTNGGAWPLDAMHERIQAGP